MKKRLTAALLAALLICALAGVALAEEAPDAPDITLETEVSIGFEGAVYFVEMASGGMDIDFGTQLIPTRDLYSTMRPSDGAHTLRVCDRRSAPGKWVVYTCINPMESGTNSVWCSLRLYSPTTTAGLTPIFYGTDPNLFAFVNHPASLKFMEATGSLAPGDYDLTVTAENIRMILTAAEAEKIKPLEYSATITWTLMLTP